MNTTPATAAASTSAPTEAAFKIDSVAKVGREVTIKGTLEGQSFELVAELKGALRTPKMKQGPSLDLVGKTLARLGKKTQIAFLSEVIACAVRSDEKPGKAKGR